MRFLRHPALLWLLALATIALFARLGAWQLDRRVEKQRMLDQVAEVLRLRQAQPLSVAADPERAIAYDWASGEGRYLDVGAVLLDSQQRQGKVGVRVYRVFAPASGAPLLVELGWLPLPGDRTLPPVPRPDARRIEGLLLPPPSSGIAAASLEAQPDGSLLATRLDPKSIASRLGLNTLSPRVLRLDPASADGYARDLDILPNTLPPEKHLGYAVQWFALASAVLIIALLLTWRARRRASRSTRMST